MLKIEHLTKKYGAKVAVDDLSLEIKPGEIYGFIGHNGAGKTTTIRCACGLLDFDEGEITINGRSIREDPLACKMDFAYIPDNPVLFDFLSGIDYLNFIGDVYKVEKSVREERIRRYSDTFEITSNLAQPISSYSHGMKQKLAIIAAMLHEPKLFVLDEPFVGLDPIAAFQFKSMMRELCDKGGAVFFSTHVLDVAEKLCDKIAIIKNGKLIKAGTMDEVKGDVSLEETFLELEREKDA
ncbi:MAG: ABC transporter ATP-binding protein [Erysipelotrichaceae bacterium]|nr:ABC transporter ATP-binding protein [Erysipelotrichaceae bacterium]